jgi:hypothetical protein
MAYNLALTDFREIVERFTTQFWWQVLSQIPNQIADRNIIHWKRVANTSRRATFSNEWLI